MNPVQVRPIQVGEIPQLEDFLYEAIYIPRGAEKPDKEIIRRPELIIYIEDFGKDTDVCLVAELDGILIGAIWSRIFAASDKSYGYVDGDTPELSMSVLKRYRNLGIGKNLLARMMTTLKRLGCKQVSLSVDRTNYAFTLYQKTGFDVLKSSGKSVIMIKKISE